MVYAFCRLDPPAKVPCAVSQQHSFLIYFYHTLLHRKVTCGHVLPPPQIHFLSSPSLDNIILAFGSFLYLTRCLRRRRNLMIITLTQSPSQLTPSNFMAFLPTCWRRHHSGFTKWHQIGESSISRRRFLLESEMAECHLHSCWSQWLS